MKKSSILETARHAVQLAQQKGAQDAAASVATVREVKVGWRDGNLEKISEATTQGLAIEVYADGRYAAVSTSDLLPATIEKICGQAIDMARSLAPDPFRRLPDPKLYEGRAAIDLELEDPVYDTLTAEQRRAFTQKIEAAAREVEGRERIVSVTTDFSDSHSEMARVTSNGFEGVVRETSFWPSAEVSVRDPDGRRPEDYDYAGAHHLSDLPDVALIGRSAAKRALGRIGATKGTSGKRTLAIDPRAAGSLLGRLMGPLSGAALQQKRSMFEGKEGQRIGSDLLDVVDDPFIVRGLGSRLFDGEGIAAKPRSIFEAGVLRSFYIDNYYGLKLGRTPTSGRSSNLTFKLGDKDQPALLKQIGDGLLVTGFLGGNSNGTTGDFSLGIQGFLIKGGELAEPFAEMNLSGNHLEFWNHLVAVGNDPFAFSSSRVPTLVFEGVQIAGT
ncbi:MAG: TldD/PmbA family protein [Myxococcales bacterium]|jgi:PmbA protein|nr:TldD/PmbA family protein [Myxococcales bacterium]